MIAPATTVIAVQSQASSNVPVAHGGPGIVGLLQFRQHLAQLPLGISALVAVPLKRLDGIPLLFDLFVEGG
jgi:hypothetical protein